jgi:hypothetical protein
MVWWLTYNEADTLNAKLGVIERGSLSRDLVKPISPLSTASANLSLLLSYREQDIKKLWSNSMTDIVNYRTMEMLCRLRAKRDPANSGKWVAQAERWLELGQSRTAWRSQQLQARQKMHAGPMAMGPNTINGDMRTSECHRLSGNE